MYDCIIFDTQTATCLLSKVHIGFPMFLAISIEIAALCACGNTY